MSNEFCTYPRCRCVVSTSSSQPEPKCPKGLELIDDAHAITHHLQKLGEHLESLAKRLPAAFDMTKMARSYRRGPWRLSITYVGNESVVSEGSDVKQ